MEPVVYLRSVLAEEEEKLAAAKYFNVVDHRAAIPADSLVIPRYSALPFYKELERDMLDMGCKLINTWKQHCYVADIRNWYEDLEFCTPKTWFRFEEMPENGPFVMKGATNSRKFEWNTHMYAEDRRDAAEVVGRLMQDSMIGEQEIYGRQYVPLKRLATGLNGLPISEEYRFFILDGKVIGSGFYWSSHLDDLDQEYSPSAVPQNFLDNVIQAVGNNIRFWVLDVAKTAKGYWIVVELNDGQQSGLSEVDPDNFYKTLKEQLCP